MNSISLQGRGREPIIHRMEGALSAPGFLVGLEDRDLRVGGRSVADDGPAAFHIGGTTECLGVGHDVMQYLFEKLRHRHGSAAVLALEGPVDAVALGAPFVL